MSKIPCSEAPCLLLLRAGPVSWSQALSGYPLANCIAVITSNAPQGLEPSIASAQDCLKDALGAMMDMLWHYSPEYSREHRTQVGHSPPPQTSWEQRRMRMGVCCFYGLCYKAASGNIFALNCPCYPSP